MSLYTAVITSKYLLYSEREFQIKKNIKSIQPIIKAIDFPYRLTAFILNTNRIIFMTFLLLSGLVFIVKFQIFRRPKIIKLVGF